MVLKSESLSFWQAFHFVHQPAIFLSSGRRCSVGWYVPPTSSARQSGMCPSIVGLWLARVLDSCPPRVALQGRDRPGAALIVPTQLREGQTGKGFH